MAVRVLETSTSDPEAALATMAALYVPETPIRFRGVGHSIDFSLTAVRAEHLTSSRLRFLGGRSSVATPPFAELMVTTVLSGRAGYTTAAQELRTQRGEAALSPTADALTASWDDLDALITQVPLVAVEHVAAQRLGQRGEHVRFEAMSPVSSAAAAQWRALVTYVHHAMGGALSLESAVRRSRGR